MAANNMSYIHVSPDVLSTLMLFQQDKLQQQILHGISRSSSSGVFCKKVALKTLVTLLKRDSNTGVFL